MDVAVGLVAQRSNERAQRLAARLVERLERLESYPADDDRDDESEGESDRNHPVVVDEATGDAVDAPAVPVDEMSDRDFVVSIGGDGTLLFVAREVGPTPILGVNLGEVGFLNAVVPADAVDVVTGLVDEYRETGSLDGRELTRLEATPVDDDWTLEPAVNEVVVHGPRRGHGGGATIEVSVDGDRYTASHADGALVATPTGSTAYNLSEGGPLVHPSADALVVTGMAASDGLPSLVVEPTATVRLAISDAETGFVISDGRNERRIEPPAAIDVSVADEPITLVGPPGNFLESLEKLD